MNDDSDLERRLRRLAPADVPNELQRRLRSAEPPACTAFPHPPRLTFLTAWLRPWPLAYTALGAMWAVILCLHLLTPAPPSSASYAPVAQAFDRTINPTPVILTAGFSADRALFLTRNDNPDYLWR